MKERYYSRKEKEAMSSRGWKVKTLSLEEERKIKSVVTKYLELGYQVKLAWDTTTIRGYHRNYLWIK